MADTLTAGLDRGPRLVPESVTTSKFDEQLQRWHANAEMHARRGCLLLSVGELSVDVGIVQNVAMGGRTIPVMTVCVRIDYWNFDLWPPSVTFLNPVTREPAPPPVRALDRVSPSEVRDALIDQHPYTRLPFLCLPGIREYHSHPQHSGDDWLLHRHLREGDLVVLCERMWQRMARNVLGMSVAIHSLATGDANSVANQLDINLLQGDADLIQRQLVEQQAAASLAPPGEGPVSAPPVGQEPEGSAPVGPESAGARSVGPELAAQESPVPTANRHEMEPVDGPDRVT